MNHTTALGLVALVFAGCAIDYNYQAFDCTPMGGEFRDYKGRFDLYLLSSGPYHVLIGWRAPQSIDADVKFFEAAEAAMGTLLIGPAP